MYPKECLMRLINGPSAWAGIAHKGDIAAFAKLIILLKNSGL